MSSSDVEQIKSRLAIHELIGEYLSLEKSGGQFKALCPFHNEKTPSMHISPERGTYYCFGCGAKGDVFAFVQEMEGVDFKGALTLLADRLGITLSQSKSSGPSKDDRDQYYALLEATTKFFEHMLSTKPERQTYLHNRGLTPETIRAFRIGYAPMSWHSLYNWLSKKFESSHIEAMGLSKKNQKGFYDRFRGRYMFPIMDAAGRVVAFSGRIAPEYSDDTAAKYMNSPETELYHKSDILYGYDTAKNAIREKKRVVVVEGQMDLVMSHQAGIAETVALSGTALTEQHIDRLKYLANEVVLALDSDSAGIRAAQKSGSVAFRKGMRVSVVVLPSKKDPADVIIESPDAWREAIEKRVPIIKHYTRLAQKKGTSPESVRELISVMVLPLIRDMDNAIERDAAVQHVADSLSVSKEAVLEEVQKLKAPVHSTVPDEAPQQVVTEHVDRATQMTEQLIGILEWKQGSTEIDHGAIATRIEQLTGISHADLKAKYAHDALAYEAEQRYGGADETLVSIVEELLSSLEEAILRKRLIALSHELKQAEEEGKESSMLLKEYRDITQRITILHTH